MEHQVLYTHITSMIKLSLHGTILYKFYGDQILDVMHNFVLVLTGMKSDLMMKYQRVRYTPNVM